MLKGGVVYKSSQKPAFPAPRTRGSGAGHRQETTAFFTVVRACANPRGHSNRVLSPGSKLAASRGLSPETASTSLGTVMGLGEVSGNEVLSMLDWLVDRQKWIEKSLANRHLEGKTLVLYSVQATWRERSVPWPLSVTTGTARGKKQVVYGMPRPRVVRSRWKYLRGTGRTVRNQVEKVRAVRNRPLVGDRGMITTARIREDLEPWGLTGYRRLSQKTSGSW